MKCSRFLLFLPLMVVALIPTLTLAAPSLDPVFSSIGTSKDSIIADGIDGAIVGVTLKDTNLGPVENVLVTLVSSRGSTDEIIAQNATTDITGKARFLVRSLRNGSAIFSAQAMSVTLQRTITLTFHDGLQTSLVTGDLIKIPDDGDGKTLSDTAVYYYASNGKRYVFPNEKVYYTWYPDFSKVKIIPLDQMSLIPIAANVTYKPGSKLVKFQTDTKTYLVTRGGVLRWAKTEDVAKSWFGPNWNKHVDDISEGFYINYKFGEPVASSLDLAIEIIQGGTKTIDQDKGLN